METVVLFTFQSNLKNQERMIKFDRFEYKITRYDVIIYF